MRTEITIVSGLPRSGTSLMMKMLEKGGMKIITDDIRKADIDNPEGYYEFEPAKKIKEDASWLKDARGKAFKIVSMLLLDLPLVETYKIIFMERKLDEVLASQKKMMNRNKPDRDRSQDLDDSSMGDIFDNHLTKIKEWLPKQKNIDVLFVHYNTLINSPEPEIDKIISFLDMPVNKTDMIEAIKSDLYRNRSL